MPRRIYPRPPITEAVVDFRFSPTVTGERLLAAVRDALGDSYTGQVKQQELLQLQATRGPTGVAAAARSSVHLTLLTSEDGLRLVGCGDGMLSVHVLAPYPGWVVFLEQTTSVVRATSSLIAESGFNQIAVRYIDRMALPVGEGVSFNDLLVAFPAKPEAMPDSVLGFQYVTQTLEPTDGTFASMVLASAPPDAEGRPVAIFDLTVWRQGTPVAGVMDDEWVTVVEQLHVRQRDIFEDSITDKLRETFQ
ncbi:MAG: TIGR04255 family protein [Myxococcota bacterium]